MKSVLLNKVRNLTVCDVNDPIKDGDEVVVKVLKAGICGSDLHYFESFAIPNLVMGHEFCGEVVYPGCRTDLKVGDRVTALPISPCNTCDACKSKNVQYCKSTWSDALGLSLSHPGAFSEYLHVRSDMVIKVPDNVTDDEAAMVEPASVSLHAVNLAKINENSKVLVVGAGIIGMLSLLFAKKMGAKMVAVSEANEERGNMAVKFNLADKFYDVKKEDTIANMLKDTEGGFDVVIECCGNSPAVTSSIVTVKEGGTVVLVGVSLKPIEVPTALIVTKELKVLGAIAYTYEEFNDVINMLANKEISLKEFITDTVSLEGVNEAFERLISGKSKDIKILVDHSK